MKVLFAIKSLNVQGGGAEKVLVDVAEGLHQRGHEVRVLTFDYPGEAFYDLSPLIERRDMAFNPAGLPMPRLDMLRALPRMRAAIAAERPDVIVAFMHSTYVPVAIAALGLGVPLVVSEHTEARHYETRPLQRRARQVVDRRAALRTVPSEAVRAGYDRLSATPAIVVPNPVALERFEACRNAPPEVPPVLLSVGRLMDEKDHAVLIDAFARVCDEFPDWRLRIVGDGPLRGDLEARVARLGLGARVEMPGITRDVGAAYARARFVVLPSRYESFGMVAAEALAAGRAVLSFDDCAGIAEIVGSGMNGVLVRGSPDREARVAALADGLRRMMGDPDLCDRLGRAGPDGVARFGLAAVLDRWEDIFCQATGRPRQI